MNGENAADGLGITPKIADKLLAAGADVITLGNHTWRRKEIVPYLSGTDRVIRPANYSKHAPGRGLTVGSIADGTKVAVINLLGSLYLEPMVSAYEIVDDLVEEARRETPIVIVDFHGEATSEKWPWHVGSTARSPVSSARTRTSRRMTPESSRVARRRLPMRA